MGGNPNVLMPPNRLPLVAAVDTTEEEELLPKALRSVWFSGTDCRLGFDPEVDRGVAEDVVVMLGWGEGMTRFC